MIDFLKGISLLQYAQKSNLPSVQWVNQCHDLATIKGSFEYDLLFHKVQSTPTTATFSLSEVTEFTQIL
jgi:hypothetical protein